MNRKVVSTLQGLVVAGVTAVAISTQAIAQDRADVLERIKPVGEVAVEGQAAPAAPAQAAAPAPAPAATPEPAAPAPAAEEPATAAAPAPAAAPAAADGEAIYGRACIACHLSGAAGAPKLGDKAAWEPRIAKGMDALLQSAINGVPGTAMTPRGTCANCSDDDLKAAIEYMISKSQ
ncbi:MAG: c-type cytochrome [Chromatiales bacterium]|nr:c-type cytochrome [Chromatiales bacterium]